jgi:hypothetical protein
MKRLSSLLLLAVLLVGSAGAVFAHSGPPATPTPTPPVFGPTKYEITAPPQQVFSDTLDVGTAGLFLVSVINGDIAIGGDHRVTSGTLIIQGHPVFPPGEINDSVKHIERRVYLDAVPTPIVAILNGEAGNFITVTITALPVPALRAGKIVLDYGSRASGNHLVLFLHNSNYLYDRAVRLIFLDMLGQAAGTSDLLTIPPSGTLPANPDTVAAPAPITWQEGSIDVIWMGPGGLPVTGYAEQVDPAGRKTILPLHNVSVPPGAGEID